LGGWRNYLNPFLILLIPFASYHQPIPNIL
jgi:hypothetical protein